MDNIITNNDVINYIASTPSHSIINHDAYINQHSHSKHELNEVSTLMIVSHNDIKPTYITVNDSIKSVIAKGSNKYIKTLQNAGININELNEKYSIPNAIIIYLHKICLMSYKRFRYIRNSHTMSVHVLHCTDPVSYIPFMDEQSRNALIKLAIDRSKELGDELNVATTKNEELQHTINALKDENDVLKDENDVLKDENDVLKDENDTLKDENDTLKDENDTLKDENDMLRDDNDVLRDDNDALKYENGVLNDENDTLKDENELLKELIRQTYKDMNSLDIPPNVLAYINDV